MENKKKLNKFSYLFMSLVLLVFFIGCDQVESVPDESGIAIGEIAGKWVVDMIYDGEPQGTSTIIIYNTANNDSNFMWIDDLEHSWGLKTKVPVNLETMTFEGSDLQELYYDVTVTITDGQIIKGGAKTPSGDVVDSISFKAEFSDIPGELWEYSGYKSTAKIADLP